jgi:adenylate kinase
MKAHFQLPIASPGVMLREQKKLGTDLGIAAEKLTSQGRLVPDEMVIQIVRAWLEQNGDGFIFDGYPRSQPQADALEAMLLSRGQPLQVAISLEASLETLRARVINRLVCLACGHTVAAGLQVSAIETPCPACGGQLGRRKDDTLEVLTRRMEEYTAKSAPLLAFYAERDLLHRVDSSAAPDNVFAAITSILEAA